MQVLWFLLVPALLIWDGLPGLAAPPPWQCCPLKIVGGLTYTLWHTDPAALTLNCKTPCVYTRNGTDKTFCFGKGKKKVQCLSNSSTTQLPMHDTKRVLLIGGGELELYPAAHFRTPSMCHGRVRPASFVTESGLLVVCGSDGHFWSPPLDETCEILDTNTQLWGQDYRVPSLPQNITCQLQLQGWGQDCNNVRVHWTDSVTLPGIGVFLFGKPVPQMSYGDKTVSVLLRTGSTSWVPTPGWIETRQLRMSPPPRGWSCIVALPKTNSILVIPGDHGRRNRVREFRASSGSEPGSWAPEESWPCLLKSCEDYSSLEDVGCSVVSNKLIIAGGRKPGFGWSGIASTAVIDLEQKTIKHAGPQGDLNYPRFGHVMATLNGALYAFGGQAWLNGGPLDNPNSHNNLPLDTVEVWDMNMETWRVLDVKMAKGRIYMAALVVDPNTLFRASGSGSESGDGDGIGSGSGSGSCKP